MGINNKSLDIPIKTSYTFLVNCNNFCFVEVFLVRRVSLLAFTLALCLCLSACSSGGESAPAPEEPTLGGPEYSLINSDEYVQGGETGIGYRVAIGDGATEEEMRAVFSDLCSGDVYSLHTVWFYGLPGDVEDIGSFSVGMLEEESSGKEPVFTPCNYDADLIAALREKAKAPEESEGAARSIPSPTIKQEALVENNRFEPVDEIIFSTPASENGLGDTPFWVEGEVVSRSDLGGYDTIQLSTEYGDLYISAAFIDFQEISEGDEATVFFVYSGFSDALGAPCGVYVYHE